jgi:hypothetical protein
MNTPELDPKNNQGLRLKKGVARKQTTFSLSICPPSEQALNRAIQLFEPFLKRPSKTLITRRAIQIYDRYLKVNRSRPEVIDEEAQALAELAKTGKLKD